MMMKSFYTKSAFALLCLADTVIATATKDPATLQVSMFPKPTESWPAGNKAPYPSLNGQWELKQGHPNKYGSAFPVISAFHYVRECYTMQHEVEKHGSKWVLCWTIRRMGVLVCKECTSDFKKMGANAIKKYRQKRCPENITWEYNTPSSKPNPCPPFFTFYHIPCPVVGCKPDNFADALTCEVCEGKGVIHITSDTMITPTYAAEWTPDKQSEECEICRKAFTKVSRRRHHCRGCGKLVCEKCSHVPVPTEFCERLCNKQNTSRGPRQCDPNPLRRRLIDRFCRESIRCIES